ncbi:MAG: polysaccharide deacetylase [Lachnospiraceae bacterium]|nr:polysaccharide deacetylase [Lachnospiraceae bacterium]
MNRKKLQLKKSVRTKIRTYGIRLGLAILFSLPYFAAAGMAMKLKMAQEELGQMALALAEGPRVSRLVDLEAVPEGTLEVPLSVADTQTADTPDDADRMQTAEAADPGEAGPAEVADTEAATDVFSEIVIQESHEVSHVADPEELGLNAPHKVYLTFDDGPSIYTDDILDILAEYGVKATFFVIGKDNPAAYARYLRIVSEGHTLGMHSYTHVYADVYESPTAFREDTEKLRTMLEDVTGVNPVYYRFPGGSTNDVSSVDMHEFAKILKEMGITYFDWNVASGDAGSRPLTAEQIAANALKGIEDRETSVILLHDTATKKESVRALPMIIEALREMDGVAILPISGETEIIHHVDLD